MTNRQMLNRATNAVGAIHSDTIWQLGVLDCARTLDLLPSNTGLLDVRTKLAERLTRQLTPAWIAEGDLFELFSVLTALWKYDPTRVTGSSLACAVRRLVACEVAPGGPYRSDGVVSIEANLQISAFIRLAAKPLPGVDAFLGKINLAELSVGDSLPSSYLLYLYAKLYKKTATTNIIAKNRSKKTSFRAIALYTLENTAAERRYAVAVIEKAQLSTGFWDDNDDMSQIVTTALIINILVTLAQKGLSMPARRLLRQHEAVLRITREQFNAHPPNLRRPILTAVDAIGQSNRAHEITLQAHSFARLLKTPSRFTARRYELLGVASVCGWIAYGIYDDFIDNEGKPVQLPVANAALRVSINSFKSALPRHRAFWRYTNDAFIKMDEASIWEIKHCRFLTQDGTITLTKLPNYGTCASLADRSIACILAPMAVLVGQPQTTQRQLRYVESAYRHYLIARQLCDDLRDWTDDLNAGQVSFVVAAILRDLQLPQGLYTLTTLIVTMQKQFRTMTLSSICALIMQHVAKARQNFKRSGLFRDDASYAMLDTIELSVRRTVDQCEKSDAFLKAQVRGHR